MGASALTSLGRYPMQVTKPDTGRQLVLKTLDSMQVVLEIIRKHSFLTLIELVQMISIGCHGIFVQTPCPNILLPLL
jgi:hypothetical protein